MEQQVTEDKVKAAFLYHLGDVIYFNGQSSLYKPQFYEPYQYYPNLIFAVPGNHDGDTQVHPGDPPDPEPSLTGFMRNFCDTVATPMPYRHTMTQPYAYWTLEAPFVTIIGLYSNVEGCLDPRGKVEQQTWLTQQLAAAPNDKKLLVTVHHPCYSLDGTHGGCPDILIAIDRAIASTRRVPDAILSGHVHNYQRFSRQMGSREIPYIVAGAGGYANDAKSMHRLQKGLVDPDGTVKLPYKTTHPDVQLINTNWQEPGFLRVTVSADNITFEYFLVPFDGSPSALFDSVTI
jgi:3',5'-cyclic AMP phosphodiesterase CpdA